MDGGAARTIDGIRMKRKLRELKRLEIRLRFGSSPHREEDLVWNRFFALREGQYGTDKRRSFRQLLEMDAAEYRRVIDEYFAFMYYELYRQKGSAADVVHDPELLARMELPFAASSDDIKKRFRELAKIHHPDTGGESARFIELMNIYKKLSAGG